MILQDRLRQQYQSMDKDQLVRNMEALKRIIMIHTNPRSLMRTYAEMDSVYKDRYGFRFR